MCVHEEDRLKHENPKGAHMVTHAKGKTKRGMCTQQFKKAYQKKKKNK
jgi:hypothetical protein